MNKIERIRKWLKRNQTEKNYNKISTLAFMFSLLWGAIFFMMCLNVIPVIFWGGVFFLVTGLFSTAFWLLSSIFEPLSESQVTEK